ncbi:MULTISPECIES: hypothetical protein, partial [unclassified Microcystis]
CPISISRFHKQKLSHKVEKSHYTKYKMNYTRLEQQSKESQIAELELFIKSVMDSRELKRALSVKM